MKTAKKALSLLLAVVMVWSSMSVIAFAAPTGVVTSMWTSLANALSNETVANASFSGPAYSYEVNDPDGSVLTAVEAYWAVLDAQADKSPADRNADNRTVNQVNATIKAKMQEMMGSSYAAYNTEAFLSAMLAGVTVPDTSTKTAESTSNSRPNTGLSAIGDIKITVKIADALGSYASPTDLPSSVVASKVFTVKHANDKWDADSRSETTGSGCNEKTTTYYFWYYYYAISEVSSADGDAIDTQVILDSHAIVEANQAVFGADTAALVEMGAEDLVTARTAINGAYDAVVDAFSSTVWTQFFAAYDIAEATADIDFALDVIKGLDVYELLENAILVSFDSIETIEALDAHYELTNGYMTNYNGLSAEVRAYLATTYGIDLTEAEAYLAALLHEKEVRHIRAIKAELDAKIEEEYNTYYLTGIADGTLKKAMLTAAVAFIDTKLAELSVYDSANVVEVCGENYIAEVNELRAELVDLGIIAGYNEAFIAEHEIYINQVVTAFATDNMTTLLGAVKSYDQWYTDLNTLVDTMVADIGTPITNMIIKTDKDTMDEGMTAAYARLDAYVTAQVDTAWAIYQTVKIEYGSITYVNVDNYYAIQSSIGLIDLDMFDYLLATEHYTMTQSTVDKYNELLHIITGLQYFEVTKGLEAYMQRELTPYAERPVYNTDIIKTEAYEVTEANLLATIEKLDGFLASDNFAALAGESLNDLLGGMVDELIYSDKFINTVVNLLYPLVQTMLAGLLYDEAYSLIAEYSLTGSLKYTCVGIFETVGINAYPESLAKVIDKNKYPEAYAALNAAKKYTAYGSDKFHTAEVEEQIWKDSNIYDAESGTLTLVWGVDAVREAGGNYRTAFYDAFGEAMKGLEKLLYALLCNKDIADVEVTKVVDLGIASLDLHLYSNSCSGYSDLLVPIFDALGVDSSVIATHDEIKTYANNGQMNNVAKAIFEPVMNLIDKVCEQPLDTVLAILPNLVYALSTNMVMPLLDKLAVSIHYKTDANGLASLIGSIKIDESYDLAVGELLADMGPAEEGELDIAGLLNNLSLEAIFELLGLELPPLDAVTIAYAGEMTTIPTKRNTYIYETSYIDAGKAYHIEADKADLLYYILQYAFELVSNEEALTGLLGAIMTQKETVEVLDEEGNPVLDEEGNPVTEEVDVLDAEGNKVPDEEKIAKVMDIIGMLDIEKPTDIIAAIVELLNMEKYDGLQNYEWYDGTVGGNVEGYTPAQAIYTSYTNDWTHATAEYAVQNLTEIIEGAAGVNISEEMHKKLGGVLFTNEMITKLAQALGTIQPDETISGLIKNLIGLDLSEFAKYADVADDTNWGFEDGDAYGFADALLAMVSPFKPAVDFIFNGEPITITLSEDEAVTLYGNNGYDNAIVPLLEALGCKPAAKPEDTLKEVVYQLVDRLCYLEDDVIDAILDMLPGVLYYFSSNALSVTVDNLLQPVYAVLDVIRPIYDVNIGELLAGLDIGFSINLDNLGVGFLADVLQSLLLKGIDLTPLKELVLEVCMVLGQEYDTVSTFLLQSDNGAKRGTYSKTFDKADMLTVILSLIIDLAKSGNNAETADDIFDTDIISGLVTLFTKGADPDEKQINWMYALEDEDLSQYNFATGVSFAPTMSYLEYPTNWTENTAAYVDENLADIVNKVVGMVDGNYDNLADFIADKLVIYSSENIQAIQTALADLLASIDENLVAAAGVLLDADVAALLGYEVPADIDTGEEFAAALADMLALIPGVVDWLLFDVDYEFMYSTDGTPAIRIYGADGYAKGLAPILEALGVELPEGKDIKAILTAVFARLDAILANPIDEVLNLLPNIIYFLNADGLTASVYNLLGAVRELLVSLQALGVDLDINTLLGDAIGLDLRDVSMPALLKFAQEKIGLTDITPITNILNGFFLGTVQSYSSVNGEYAYRMVYDSDMARYDMITILATVVLETIKIDANADDLKELLGEDIYNVILSFFDMAEAPIKEIEFRDTDKADTGYVFSALNSSELYPDFQYGPMYTEDMAKYIAVNFGDFVDNIIYLLGLEINGTTVNDLKELIDAFVGGSVYSSELINTIVDALNGLVDKLEALGDGVGTHLVAVLKTSLGVDLAAYRTMTFEAFDNDRARFEKAFIEVVKPVFPLLKWLLCDKDFTFFVDEDEEVMITLKGAEGYAYGIIPLLEALGIEPDALVSSTDYYDAVAADENVLITSILKPLLDRVDEILAAPADEILDMLPNIIYFINSNGVDAVVKNTLNAVYTVLNAIEPIEKIDLYEMIGLDLSTLDFEQLFTLLLGAIEDATGYGFTYLHADAIAELTTGKLVSYESANGKTAYKMVYTSSGNVGGKADMVTVVMRLLVNFIMHENNREAVLGLLRDNLGMSADAEKYISAIFDSIAIYAVGTNIGMDQALCVLYYVFYSVDIGADESVGFIKDLNSEWQEILESLGKSDNPDELTVGNLLAGILDIIGEDVFTSEGLAPNGLIKFFQRIIEWFNIIIDFFKELFATQQTAA